MAKAKALNNMQRHVQAFYELKKYDLEKLHEEHKTLVKMAEAINISYQLMRSICQKTYINDEETFYDYIKRKKKEVAREKYIGKKVGKKLRLRPKQGIYKPSLKLKIAQILKGVSENFIQRKIFSEAVLDLGYKDRCCDVCGFTDGRKEDGKFPLFVCQKNPFDAKNYKLENLQVLCFNHYFINVGSLHLMKRYMTNSTSIMRVLNKEGSNGKYLNPRNEITPENFPMDVYGDVESEVKEELKKLHFNDSEVEEREIIANQIIKNLGR